MFKRLYYIVCILFITLLISCNAAKYVPEGETYYNSVGIQLQGWDSSKVKNAVLQENLMALLRPVPNNTLFGMPLSVYLYNLAGDPKKQGGIRKFIRKMGTAPVTTNFNAAKSNASILKNNLENNGYFYNNVTFDTILHGNKLDVFYTATIDTQYMVRRQRIVNSDSVSDLGKELNVMNDQFRQNFLAFQKKNQKRKRVRRKRAYSLDAIMDFRTRMDSRLKNNGFYYFSPDYFLALADSQLDNHQVDLKYVIKRSTPAVAKKQFRINKIFVFSDYEIGSDTSLTGLEKIPGDSGSYLKSIFKEVKPSVFSRLIGFHHGELYNRNDHSLALNRLQSLGMYRFVKARFEETDTVSEPGGWLNTFYYLTPTAKKSLRFEVSGYTKSNNSNGSELSLNWTNRNFFGGAEQFTARVYGAIEKQVLKNTPNVNMRRVGAEVNLLIPRILAPFEVKTNHAYVPQTKIALSYEYYSRSSQYTLNSSTVSWGYIFKQNAAKEHQLNIFSLSYVRPTHITDSFQNALDTNVVLRRSIERQFIIGPNYNFNYSTLNNANSQNQKNNFYFNLNVDLSGNLMGLLSGANINKGKERRIFGVPYSQYVRTEVDFRHYLRLSRNSTLASRALLGMGLAYGNSTSMPFVKSFFVGGPNDLRAFSARSLGPGGYYAGNPRFASNFLGAQPGDMKMEVNTELRSKLYSIMSGALFVDAGNTWLLRNDPSRPDGKFGSSFYKQIAVGTGAGLRFDANILILRLDLGIPLRSPDVENGFQWNFHQMNWGWVQHNWVWNIAIGYPF